MKIKGKWVEIIDLNFVVHSNEMACRKKGRLGMDHVYYEARGVILAESGAYVAIGVVFGTSTVRGVIFGMVQDISGAVGGMFSSPGPIGVIFGMSTARGVVVGTV